MLSSPSQSTAFSVPGARSRPQGPVIAPDDPAYDEARNGLRRAASTAGPPSIVRVADAADVPRGISLARETGLELAVRSGGHSARRPRRLRRRDRARPRGHAALDIDVEGRTAWAETGLTAGEYTTAAGAHGLATGFGDTGSVGIGGITLGGGVGFLVRKHGLTIDDLLAAEVVTADGELAARRTPRRIRTSSGPSAAAAATSASRPASSSGCTRSTRSWAARCSCRRLPT